MKMKKLLLLCVVALFTMLSVVSVSMVTAKGTENAASVGVYAASRDDSELLSKYLAEPVETSDYYIDANQELEVIIELSDVPSVLTALADLPMSMTVAEFANTSDYNSLILEIKKSQDKLIAALGNIFELTERFEVVNNAIVGIMKYSDYTSLPANNAVNKMIQGLAVSQEYTVPETANSAVHMQVDLVREDVDLGYRGQGMLIGVIDTGLMVAHEAFQVMPPAETLRYKNASYIDSIASLLSARVSSSVLSSTVTARNPWQNSKVVYTFDYTGNVVNVSPTASTAENLNHGSHVAGIAAGNNGKGFTGVAPDAQLAIFKVFNSTGGGASSTVIMRAIQDAAIIGVDVLNMSLGHPSGFVIPDISEVDYYTAARKAGVVITNSAGNAFAASMNGNLSSLPSWANPDYGTVGADSTLPQCLSIASSDPYQYYFATVGAGTAGEYVVTYNEIPDRSMGKEILGDKEEVTYEYVIIPNFARPADFAGLDLTGKIAIMSRGDGVNFEDKLNNAKAVGAVAGFVYDNVNGTWINMQMTGSTIPGGFMYMNDGHKLINMPEGQRTITFRKSDVVITMSDFSGWGAPSTNSLVLKPELSAPGGSVYSSVPKASGSSVVSEYIWMPGTSMAAPNAAGSVALVKQYINEFLPSEYESGISAAEKQSRIDAKYLMSIRLLMSTAFQNASQVGVTYSPRKQGAGMVQLYNALKTSAYITVDDQEMTKIELSYDAEKSGVYEMSFNVVNFGTTELTYLVKPITLTDELGFVVNGVQTLSLHAYKLNPTYVVEGGNTIKVAAGQTLKVNLTITLSAEDKAYLDRFPNGEYVDGFIKLYQQNVESPIDLSVPFLGFYGDWERLPVFDAYEISGVAYQMAPTRVRARGYTSATQYTMGDYVLTLESGVSKPVGNIERAALSPLNTKSLFYYLYGMSYASMRNIWEAKFTVVDYATGQVYYSYVQDGWYKTFMDQNTGAISAYTTNGGNSTFGFRFTGASVKAGYANLPNNTKLLLEVQFMMEGQSGYYHSEAFPFTIDNTTPIIAEETAVTYVENGKTYLEVDVWDNQYLMAYDAWFTTLSGETLKQGTRVSTNTRPIPVYNQAHAGEIHTLKFDITNKLALLQATNYVQISVIDYAYNEIIWNVPVVAGSARTAGVTGEYTLEKIAGTSPASDFTVNSYGELTKYKGTSNYVVIPDYITRIGPNAFADFMPATIIINDNVKAIAENAFADATGFKTTITFTGKYAPALEGGYVNTSTVGYNASYSNFGDMYIIVPMGGIGYGYNWTNLQAGNVKVSITSGDPEIDELLAVIRELQAQIADLEAQIKELGGVSAIELEALRAELAKALADVEKYESLYSKASSDLAKSEAEKAELLKEIEELKKQLKTEEELEQLKKDIEDERRTVAACSTVGAGSSSGWTGGIALATLLFGCALLLTRKKKVVA